MQQANVQKIAIDALGDLGFAPDNLDVVIPKQKNFFDVNTDPLKGMSGADLNSQIEAENKLEQEKVVETPVIEEVKPKIVNKHITDETLFDEFGKALKEDKIEGAAETTAQTEEGTEPIKGKKALVNFLKGKIEKGDFVAYNDYDDKQPIGDYLNALPTDQLEALIDQNYDVKREKDREEDQSAWYQSLPGHLRYVAESLAKSEDPQSIYSALFRAEQSAALDPDNEHDQEAIATNWLTVQGNYSNTEIADQVQEWKEAGSLAKRAAQFKPKLDKLQEEQIQAYAQQSEQYKQQQEQASQWYVSSVQDALKDADLGGLKLTKKQQANLYNEMVLNIKPSQRDGRPLNGLWQALERIQVAEPNYKHLAEITWLATDPKGYKEMLIQSGRNEQQSKVTKELKTLQGSDRGLGEEMKVEEKKRGLPRQVNPFEAAERNYKR